jgi:SAM-dependent methyltransferase
MTSLLSKLRFAAHEVEWRAIGAGRGLCPLCRGRLFVRISRDLLGTRCLRCGASPISMAIGAVVPRLLPDFASRRICELSSQGPFFEFLTRRLGAANGSLASSEYFDDVAVGESRDGVQCQDVQQLTYASSSFDLCTSTEVFEHVPDDRRGFVEIHRVLVPGGWFVFTVPMHDCERTVERAVLEEGAVRHLLEPTWHDDVIRGSGRVLVYRDYGRDVTARLTGAGFRDAEILDVPDPAGLGCVAQVVCARKP